MTLPLVALVLAGPLLLLASAVLALAAHGPLGWLAAAALLAGVAAACRWTGRRCWRWWVSTKAPVRATAGRGPASAARRGPPGGTWPA